MILFKQKKRLSASNMVIGIEFIILSALITSSKQSYRLFSTNKLRSDTFFTYFSSAITEIISVFEISATIFSQHAYNIHSNKMFSICFNIILKVVAILKHSFIIQSKPKKN